MKWLNNNKKFFYPPPSVPTCISARAQAEANSSGVDNEIKLLARIDASPDDTTRALELDKPAA